MTAALRRLALAATAAGTGAALARRFRQRPEKPPEGARRVVCVGAGFAVSR